MNLFKNAKLLQTAKISRKAEEVDKFKAEVIIAIGRFFNNDWGDVCESDKNTNTEAIKYYEMVVASYETSEGDIFITLWTNTMTLRLDLRKQEAYNGCKR